MVIRFPWLKAIPSFRHFTAYSCQLTAYRKSAASRHPSCGFAAARLTKKEGALLGRLSAFCIKEVLCRTSISKGLHTGDYLN